METGPYTWQPSPLPLSSQAGNRNNCGPPIRGPRPEDASVYAKASGAKEMKYAILYAPTSTGYSAHVPDLPGCVAAATLEETRQLMKEAIEGHLECMRKYGYEIPTPVTVAEGIEVPID